MIANAEKPEALAGTRKAAIMLVMLGDQASAEFIRHLSEDEVQLVSREVARISTITTEQAEGVAEEFYQMTMRAWHAARRRAWKSARRCSGGCSTASAGRWTAGRRSTPPRTTTCSTRRPARSSGNISPSL